MVGGPDGKLYFTAGNCSAVFTDKSGKTFRIGSAYDPIGRGDAGDLGWNPPGNRRRQKSDDGHVSMAVFGADGPGRRRG